MDKRMTSIIGFAVACTVVIMAAMSSCTVSPDKYAALSELSAASINRPSSLAAPTGEQSQRQSVSIAELPATFSEAEYSYDSSLGRLVRVSTPNMYSSKIPESYKVNQSSGGPVDQSSVSSPPSKPVPPESPKPTTSSTGQPADLTSAQRAKIVGLLSINLLDNVSFENDEIKDDTMIAAALLAGSDQIQSGFDTYIEKSVMQQLCRDIFGRHPFGSKKLSSQYIISKNDKCNIKKMPESNYYSKQISEIQDLGDNYYKVIAELTENGTVKGNAIYIIKADSAATYGFVIFAQKITSTIQN